MRRDPQCSGGRSVLFRVYPNHRQVAHSWLGSIPDHWGVTRFKGLVRSCRNGTWGEPPSGEGDVVCVRVADFDRDYLSVDLTSPTLRSVEEGMLRRDRLRPSDLLLEKSGGGEKHPVGQVVSYDHDVQAVCSNFIARMPVRTGVASRYVLYLHAAAYAARLSTRSIKQSTGIQNLDAPAYLAEPVPLPPLQEQRSVSAFLDRGVAKINRLIEKKGRLIELLEEKRTTLISDAVTKGLDPDVPMKDSGAEWLGQVPAHWGVVRTKHAARLESGHTPSRTHPEYWEDCDVQWFGLADVWQLRADRVEYVYQTAEKVSELGLANSSARLLPQGTVLLSRTASVGFSAIMGTPMATTQDFVNWICGPDLIPEYLLYVFRSMRPEFRRLAMGSTHQTIYMPDIGRFVTPIPPVEEQAAIIEHIHCGKSHLDDLVDKTNEAIALLREYRSALISAAVTGKIDVRGEVDTEELES